MQLNIANINYRHVSSTGQCLKRPCANFPFFDVFIPHSLSVKHLHLNHTKQKHMAVINPHINFNGNAEEAFTFYKSVFGGEFSKFVRLKDLASAEFPVAEEDENKILHIALPVGSSNFLMGNDVPAFLGPVNENENRSKISISTESREEADKLFAGLSSGGNVEMPITDSPWGSYFGMFRDKFGIEWMIEFASEHTESV